MQNQALQGPVTLAARILLAVLFLASGFGKIMGYDQTAGYMASHGLPLVSVLLPLTILIEFGGGVMLVLGWFTRPIAIVMFLFIIPVTLTFHTAGDMNNNIHFMKNLGIMGGMLLLYLQGAGPWSIDARGAKA